MDDLYYCALGNRPYRVTWELQKALQQVIIRAKRANPPVYLPHLVLGVEHPPVYTLGKSGDERNLLLSEDRLASIGATFERIDRGGDITFHGPGQLVLYPILDLDRLFTDLGRYLRTLEESVIKTLAAFNIPGHRVPGRTGVWISDKVDARAAESSATAGGGSRKICAMGIRCSRWVTIHGLALNVSTDLSYFDNIVPCGIQDAAVTSIEQELGHTVSADAVSTVLVNQLAKELGLGIHHLDHTESVKFLTDFAKGTG
jgi:lipoyl(octanoyl) transferase